MDFVPSFQTLFYDISDLFFLLILVLPVYHPEYHSYVIPDLIRNLHNKILE